MANRVFGSNQIIYENLKFSLNSPIDDEISSDNGCVPQLWFDRSVAFYQVAIFQQFLGNYGMAAFCLHQVAEQALIFLIRSIAGVKIGTHNLDRLLKFAKFYIDNSREIFFTQNIQEKNVLDYLRMLMSITDIKECWLVVNQTLIISNVFG